VVMLSATDGDDKPGKYPKMFRTSDAMLISKTDLLPYVPFDVESAKEDARRIRSDLTILTVSSVKGEGIEAWCHYLEAMREKLIQSSKKSEDCDAERSGIQ
jgi:hydrogenase nickel incorporation protein HypB